MRSSSGKAKRNRNLDNPKRGMNYTKTERSVIISLVREAILNNTADIPAMCNIRLKLDQWLEIHEKYKFLCQNLVIKDKSRGIASMKTFWKNIKARCKTQVINVIASTKDNPSEQNLDMKKDDQAKILFNFLSKLDIENESNKIIIDVFPELIESFLLNHIYKESSTRSAEGALAQSKFDLEKFKESFQLEVIRNLDKTHSTMDNMLYEYDSVNKYFPYGIKEVEGKEIKTMLENGENMEASQAPHHQYSCRWHDRAAKR
ncbi:MAG: hypothetical protein MHMPM18_001298 [Marteilia pararefringens]